MIRGYVSDYDFLFIGSRKHSVKTDLLRNRFYVLTLDVISVCSRNHIKSAEDACLYMFAFSDCFTDKRIR